MIATDTITAISTAMNNSGIGIIRISGPEAFDIIRKIFRPGGTADPDKDFCQKSHTVHYGHIIENNNKIIDEVLVLIMKAPRTYTREDTVEIDCHGGMFVMNRVLEQVIKAGARTAQPGEFTKRAFLNGRIDLSQAEAVIDVINAENDFALQSAVTQLKGSVSEKIRNIREVLLEQTAFIESALDDPEHIEMDGYGEILLPMLRECSAKIKGLIDTSQDGRIIKEGIKTVILGKPNVGKSSLMNALLGTQRAIVTQIPGTTRDALEESLRISDITLNIVDTAGIRDTQDVVEKIGVDKALEYAESADLIVWVVDSSAPLTDDDREIAKIIKGKKAIVLLNKNDLKEVTGRDEILQMIYTNIHVCTNAENNLTMSDNIPDVPIISISALMEEGLEEFAEAVRHMFYNKEINFNDQVYITNMRHKEALISAQDSLDKAMESIENGMSEDFFTIDMMDAYSALGTVIGEVLEDDLADEIFSKFCMGK